MKPIGWILTMAVATLGAVPVAAATQSGTARIVVGGRVVPTDVSPQVIHGTTLVPLRFIADALGADVRWDAARQQAVITYQQRQIVAREGSDELVAGDRVIQTRVPVQVILGRTMVPLRAVAESFGAFVDWDPSTLTVFVRMPGSQENAGPGADNETTEQDTETNDESSEIPDQGQVEVVKPPLRVPTSPRVLRQSLDLSLRSSQQSYRIGTPVQFTFRVQNTGDDPVTLRMPTSQQYDFVVLSDDGQEVWRWSRGQAFAQRITDLTIAPVETRFYRVTWDQRDNDGNLVPRGTYTLVAVLTNEGMGNRPLQASKTVRITR